MNGTPTVHYYWRPGCPFCSRLRSQLDHAGIATVDHNIWSDDEAAGVVRQYANGNETVPTVVIGDGADAVGLVNPPIAAIRDQIAALSN